MRLALALVAVSAMATAPGCKFQPGSSGANSGDASEPASDSPPLDPAIDASTDASGDASNATLDASTATPLLVHDFENSLIGPFTNAYELNNDTVNQSATAHGGTKSAICTSQNPSPAQAALYLDFTNRTQLYASMWIRLGNGFPPSDYVMIMAFVDIPSATVWNNVAQVAVFSDMRVGIFNNATGTNYYSTSKLTTNTWYHIEALVKVSSTGGRLLLAVNGVVEVNMTGIDTGTLQLDKFLAGIAWQGAQNDATTLYIDDIRLE